MRNILNTFLFPARPLGQSRPARWGRALAAVGLLALAPLAGRAQNLTWTDAVTPAMSSASSNSAKATALNAAGDAFVVGRHDNSAVFGNTTLPGNGYYLAKRNSAGAWLWAVEIGGNGGSVADVAVVGTSVYVAGTFQAPATVAGTALASGRVFVVKYTDNGSSASVNWVKGDGDYFISGISGLAASSTGVYVTGAFQGTTTVAGQSLTGAGFDDFFVAKYVDNGSSASNGWATRAGGSNVDRAADIAVAGTGVYLTGYFQGTTTVAGTTLTSAAGSADIFVAKYVDNGSSASNGWATRAGGTDTDIATGVAVAGTSVTLTGYFQGTTTVAGTTLTSAGGYDAFVAKYVDNGNSADNGWATRAGGTGFDVANGVAVAGTSVYVTGYFQGTATVAGTTLTSVGSQDIFVAKYVDGGSSATNGGSVRAGGAGYSGPFGTTDSDAGSGIAAANGRVAVAANATPPASFGTITLAGSGYSSTVGVLGLLRDTPPAPTLTGISPTSGPVGTSVTLTGTNLTGATKVTFGATAATFTVDATGTSITATVPSNFAGSVAVQVTTPGGTSNTPIFLVTAAPTVSTTLPATNVTTTSATVGGNVTDDGRASVTDRGVVYVAGTGTPTVNGTGTKATASPATGTGSFSVNVSGLTPATQYTVRAYATNSVGTSYGSSGTFTTAAPVATITTGTVSGSPFCEGSAISVPFTASVAPGRNNLYRAQLSDASGAFDSPIILGILDIAATSGTISGFIPAATASGTGYRVRVVSNDPVIIGSDNGTNLTINNTPAPIGAASQTFASGATLSNIVATGTAIQYYANDQGGMALTGSMALVNGTTYYLSQTLNGCESRDRLAVRVTVSAPTPTDLTVSGGSASAPTSIPAGTYGTITVASTGYAQLGGAVVVNTALVVNGGLNTNCQPLTGAGSFTLAAGGTLGICDAAGITATGSTGAVQVTGNRSFSTDASYLYNGTTAQATGTGLPAQVRNLTINSSNVNSTITLSAATSVAQVLAVTQGSLVSNAVSGANLTLLSSATGTALYAPIGQGQVAGQVTVQRYIDGSLNPGLGYRHFAAPVSRATVASFGTATGNGGFTPVLTQDYNTSATPGTTTPFPNVFSYNQNRLATATNNLAPFDKGFVVPGSVNTELSLTVGYAVNIAAGQTVSFNGQLTNVRAGGVGASRGEGPDAGWNLLGNPYAAPLDWSKFTSLPNMDRAMYVVQSTGQYAGGYRSYVNGQSNTGNPNPLIASGQGFFVRVSAGQTSGVVNFSSEFLVTDYATAQQAPFQRPAADARPALRLSLAGNGLADGWLTYAETGATLAFDGQYDATKLPNSHGLNLSSATSTDELAIDAQPAYAEATVLPLTVGVPAAGTYTISADELRNLPAGLVPYLRDAQTGTTTALAAGSSYAFSVANATALVRGRFALVFRPGTVLATATSLSAAQVSVYPNPAHEQFTVQVPALSGAASVQAELLNSLGQVVRRQSVALPAAGATFMVPTAGLATGVYTLRLQAGASSLAKRVVVQ